MFSKALSVVLLTCALFSGQLMAGHKGHEFMWVKNVDHQLRHEADSDELRAVAEESAEGLREHFTGKIAQTRSGTALSHLLPDAA